MISNGGESSYNFTSIWTGRILAKSLVPGTKYAPNKSFSPAALVIWIAPRNKLVHYCFNLTFKQITFETFLRDVKARKNVMHQEINQALVQ